MDEKTGVLVCLAAAVGAGCGPCFTHYHARAVAAGLEADQVREAVDLAEQVKTGARVVMRGLVRRVCAGGSPETRSVPAGTCLQ